MDTHRMLPSLNGGYDRTCDEHRLSCGQTTAVGATSGGGAAALCSYFSRAISR